MGMNFGNDTGSLVNHVMSRHPDPQNAVTPGTGATLLGWTDRYAATVTAVTGDILTVREDRVTRTDKNGPSKQQTYDYAPDPNGVVRHYQLDRSGDWVEVERQCHSGRWTIKADGYRLMVGIRDQYFDFSY